MQDTVVIFWEPSHNLVNFLCFIFSFSSFQVEDQSFSAHRIVLAATIPYFYAMFTHDMAESRVKEITMKEIDPQYVHFSVFNWTFFFLLNSLIEFFFSAFYLQSSRKPHKFCLQWYCKN